MSFIIYVAVAIVVVIYASLKNSKRSKNVVKNNQRTVNGSDNKSSTDIYYSKRHYGIPNDRIHDEIHNSGHNHDKSDILCRANENTKDFDDNKMLYGNDITGVNRAGKESAAQLKRDYTDVNSHNGLSDNLSGICNDSRLTDTFATGMNFEGFVSTFSIDKQESEKSELMKEVEDIMIKGYTVKSLF